MMLTALYDAFGRLSQKDFGGAVDLITANSRRTAPPVRTLISDRRSGRVTMAQTQREESTVGEGQGRIAQM